MVFLLVDISVANSTPAIPNVVCACSSCTEEVVVPSSNPIYPPAGVLSISLLACVTPSGTGFCSVDCSASQGRWTETTTSAFVPCLYIMTVPSPASGLW